jgi:hypothetical protein
MVAGEPRQGASDKRITTKGRVAGYTPPELWQNRFEERWLGWVREECSDEPD